MHLFHFHAIKAVNQLDFFKSLIVSMMHRSECPASDMFAALFQDRCRHLLETAHGADFLLDRQTGEFGAAALFAREQLV